MRRRAVLGAAGIAVVLAGCGIGDDRDQAQRAVERFYAAIEQDRGAGACAELSPAAVKQVEGQSGQACDSVITRLQYEPGPIADSQVFVTSARVELVTGESAFLTREGSGWKLSAVACRPEHGKPRDRPFECEVAA